MQWSPIRRSGHICCAGPSARRTISPRGGCTRHFLTGSILTWRKPVRRCSLSGTTQLTSAPVSTSFDAALPSEVSGTGSRANLASFLCAVRGVETHPVFRAQAFETAYSLTAWPHQPSASPSRRYADALAFLDEFVDQCRLQGIAPMRDRLDAQGVLWRVLSGQPEPGWSSKEVQAYESFLKGQTVDELAELVEQFRAEVEYPETGRPERETERAELELGLTQDGLEDPDVHLLRRLAGTGIRRTGPAAGIQRAAADRRGNRRGREHPAVLAVRTRCS